MSTVCGIIDGTGSVGSAVQGVIIGAVSKWLGWSAVFYMLMLFCLLAALMICRIVYAEWKVCTHKFVLLCQQHVSGMALSGAPLHVPVRS